MGSDMPSVIEWLSGYHNTSIAFVEAVGKVLIELRCNGQISPLDLRELEIAHREFNKYLRK